MVTERTVVPTPGRMLLARGFLVHLIRFRDFDSRHGRTQTLCGYDEPSPDFTRDTSGYEDCPFCVEIHEQMKRGGA